MRVTVNGEPVGIEITNLNNLEELLLMLQKQGVPENHLIGTIKVDGEMFTESYPGQSKEIGLTAIGNVEVITVSSEQLASAITKDSAVFIDRLVQGTNKTAELFRIADESEANTHFVNLVEAMRDFIQVIGRLQSILRWDFKEIVYEGEPVQAEWDRLIGLIDELTEVHEQRDWILIADLLEYELAPCFAKWGEIFNKKLTAKQSAL